MVNLEVIMDIGLCPKCKGDLINFYDYEYANTEINCPHCGVKLFIMYNEWFDENMQEMITETIFEIVE
jgi:hydrogenase maturation factor HypF (carbamoyltransferase family)